MTNQEACAAAIREGLVSTSTEFWKGAKAEGKTGPQWYTWLRGTELSFDEIPEDWYELFGKEGFSFEAWENAGHELLPCHNFPKYGKPDVLHISWRRGVVTCSYL